MTLHTHLKQLLKQDYLPEIRDQIITLKGGEKENAYTVKLTGVDTENISVIDLGKNPHSSLISTQGGYNKICDYLIFIPQENGKVAALFCELKKTFKNKGRQQLYSSLPFFDYIRSLLHTHFEESPEFTKRFFIISTEISPRLNKQTTRPQPIRKEPIDYKNIEITVVVSNLKSIPFKKLFQ